MVEYMKMRDELLRRVAPIHVEGVLTVILSAGIGRRPCNCRLLFSKVAQLRLMNTWILGTSGTMPYV